MSRADPDLVLEFACYSAVAQFEVPSQNRIVLLWEGHSEARNFVRCELSQVVEFQLQASPWTGKVM